MRGNGGLAIPITACPDGTSRDTCFTVKAGSISVKPDNKRDGSHRITCTFQTTGFVGENQILLMEIEGAYSTFGSRYTQAVHFGPREFPGVEVQLKQLYIVPLRGEVHGISSDGKAKLAWEKSWFYHSSVVNAGSYSISIVIEDFIARYFEEIDEYKPEMAVGAIGGFAFWMVILHTIVMIIFGFFMTNTSKFLGSASAERTHQGYEDLENKT